MQIKLSPVERDREELNQDVYRQMGHQVAGLCDTLKSGTEQMESRENGEEPTKDTKASGTILPATDLRKEDLSGRSSERGLPLGKCPNVPSCPKRSLKKATKPRKANEAKKSASDSSSKAPLLARKEKRSQPTTNGKGLQAPPRMSKARLESFDSEPLDDANPEAPALDQRRSSEVSQLEEKKLDDPRGAGPFFYIGGGNGAHLVNAYCMSRGWLRIQDSKRDDYKLKWCETKCSATYYSFREGEQLLYQIPNNKILTSKIGLLSSLREYDRVMQKVNKIWNPRLLKIDDFFPETLRLDVKDEREAFFSLYREGQTWICKPTGLNQGRGIFLLKSPEEVNALCCQLQALNDDPMYRKMPYKSPQARIVQRYLHNPLLLDGRKFDVRSYLLIASTVPYVVFFRHGYVRLTCNHYDPKSDDLTGHLTNQYMQKKNPLYSELKEETVWGMERFNSYVNEKFAAAKGLPLDWVLSVFTKRMQQIMMHCFLAVKSKLECRMGFFDLIGCDFLIDVDFKVWILEMNCNPALHTNCRVLKDVIPSVVSETLDLALEIFSKSLKSQRILPLNTQSMFVLLYNGDLNEQAMKFNRAKTTLSPVRVQKTLQADSSHEPAKNGDKPAKKVKVPSDNGNINGAKLATSRVTQRTTLSMSPVQVTDIPSGIAPCAVKPKPKSEPILSSVSASDVTSEAGQRPKRSEHPTPIVEVSFPSPQRIRILGSKFPQYSKGNPYAPPRNCNQEPTSSRKTQILHIKPYIEPGDLMGLVPIEGTHNKAEKNATVPGE